ncbi:hypothetical protein CcI49_35115 [Frankia sp. CcI49]|uniref:WD40 repeat domain-containing serine/threonine protein kinase n=1 Tax=Frankia sp. CcI49 TaxID=1745382 RepID=UPI000976C2D0|nr:serine/threonine-protein kinase [Frankia sp. CcI49]ONH51762.1 hypothetical protein CcI49_35115 [Frankia sp. CcI49]
MIEEKERIAALVPGYELGARLGRGAFGLVLAGRHRELHRDVAIKILFVGQEGDTEPNKGEARLLASLDHPHIVRVYDAVTAEDLHLIVMEMLAGGTLARRQQDLTAEASCAVGLATATALSVAHARGVLHRDIKPANILFDADNLLKVTDFGIAKMAEGTATTASGVMGTPRYMAPEQFLVGQLGPATDLYALGVMLYELLSGEPPFLAPNPFALAQQHVTAVPPPLTGVDESLAAVVMRALAKDPADRPASAHAFALELARAATETYGPGWAGGTGIRLRLDDDIRAIVERPAMVAPVVPAPVTSAPRAQAPTPNDELPTQQSDLPWFVSTDRAVDGIPRVQLPGKASAWSRRRQRAIHARPMGTPFRHTHGVHSAAFSSDGRMLASASHDTVWLWSIFNPASALNSFTVRPSRVCSVAFSSDGRMLASASHDKTVLLWKRTGLALSSPLAGHAGEVCSVVFAPDGRTLASGGTDAKVRLWDVSSWNTPGPLGDPLAGHTGAVSSVVFASDGGILASGSEDTTVRLWRVNRTSAERRQER